MSLTYYTVLLYALFRSMRGVVRVKKSLNWIAENSKSLYTKNASNKKINLYFLIPVLKEQEIIKQTFNVFTKLKGNFKIVFITTKKEDSERKKQLAILKSKKNQILNPRSLNKFLNLTHGIFPKSEATHLYQKTWKDIVGGFNNLLSTEDILKKLLLKSSKSIKGKVLIYRYPKEDGNMANQLNFALKKIAETEDLDSTYTAIYNADSVVSVNLPILIKNYIRKNSKALVIQQSALFLSNYDSLGNSIQGLFLKSIAFLQSRWTLAHELPRILKQLKSKLEGAHVVGHGLIINLKVMKKAGFFPTNYVNEDLPLGYILKLNGYNIYPFPLLENAQSPTSIKSMFTQYTTWFYGVFHYPLYVKNAFVNFKSVKVRALVWGVKYTIRAVMWLLLSFIWLYVLLYPLTVQNYGLFVVSVVIFFIYSAVCWYIMIKELNKAKNKIFGKGVYKEPIVNLLTYFMSIPAYLTHSYGPTIATYNTLKSLFLKTKIQKNKTER